MADPGEGREGGGGGIGGGGARDPPPPPLFLDQPPPFSQGLDEALEDMRFTITLKLLHSSSWSNTCHSFGLNILTT